VTLAEIDFDRLIDRGVTPQYRSIRFPSVTAIFRSLSMWGQLVSS
jgi:hypothetical protein